MRKLEGPHDPARKLPRTFLKLIPPALVLLLLVILLLHLISHHRQQPEDAAPDWAAALPLQPLRIGPLELAQLPVATRFDEPLRRTPGAPPDLATDDTATGDVPPGGGNPVRSVADGRVVFAGQPDDRSGGVILIAHRVRAHQQPGSESMDPSTAGESGTGVEDAADRLVISHYAGLRQRRAITGQLVHRGQVIGTVGPDDDGAPGRLQFGLRRGRALATDPGPTDDDPIDAWSFLRDHGAGGEQRLIPAPGLVERPPDVLIQVVDDEPPPATELDEHVDEHDREPDAAP